jgi:peptide/nickel transport system ATP-binding protein
MTTMLDASTTAALVAVIRDYQQRTNAGILAISHDTVLLDRWTDRTLHLTATGRLQPERPHQNAPQPWTTTARASGVDSGCRGVGRRRTGRRGCR